MWVHTTPPIVCSMTRIPHDTSGEPNPLKAFSLDQLRRRTSMKWRTYPDDVLPVWVAEMDVELPGPVVRAVTDALRSGDTGYPAGTAYTKALASFARQAVGLVRARRGAHRDRAGRDAGRGRDAPAGHRARRPGRGEPPVYPPFYDFVRHADRRIVEAPLGADARLGLDVLERAFREAAAGGGRAAYLLCSPHNPTGTVHTAEELTAVAALAERYGVRVVADEITTPPGVRRRALRAVPERARR